MVWPTLSSIDLIICYDRKLTLLKQVYKHSWTCNYAKRYAAGRDITNQSGRVENNTSILPLFSTFVIKRDGDIEQAAADRTELQTYSIQRSYLEL